MIYYQVMRVFLFLIVLLLGGITYVVFPFVTPVKQNAVESKALAMCERLYTANSYAKLYPLPSFFDCKCYASALVTENGSARAAEFLERKRNDLLGLAESFVTNGPVNLQAHPDDSGVIRSTARACLADNF